MHYSLTQGHEIVPLLCLAGVRMGVNTPRDGQFAWGDDWRLPDHLSVNWELTYLWVGLEYLRGWTRVSVSTMV